MFIFLFAGEISPPSLTALALAFLERGWDGIVHFDAGFGLGLVSDFNFPDFRICQDERGVLGYLDWISVWQDWGIERGFAGGGKG